MHPDKSQVRHPSSSPVLMANSLSPYTDLPTVGNQSAFVLYYGSSHLIIPNNTTALGTTRSSTTPCPPTSTLLSKPVMSGAEAGFPANPLEHTVGQPAGNAAPQRRPAQATLEAASVGLVGAQSPALHWPLTPTFDGHGLPTPTPQHVRGPVLNVPLAPNPRFNPDLSSPVPTV